MPFYANESFGNIVRKEVNIDNDTFIGIEKIAAVYQASEAKAKELCES